MAKTTYILHIFEQHKAAAGALCIVLRTKVESQSITYNEGDSVDSAVITPTEDGGSKLTPAPNFIGTGICRTLSNNKFSIIVNGVTYTIDIYGNEANPGDDGQQYVVWLCEVQDKNTGAGDIIESSTTTTTTRGMTPEGETWTTEVTEEGKTTVSSLSARDQFAIQALRGMLAKIGDPSVLSDNEMNFYCNAAYQWAANMMTAAANNRSTLTIDKEGEEDPTVADNTNYENVEIPENNTEKLLNNIVYALQRTDAVVGKVDPEDPDSANIYAERIMLSNLDAEGIDALVKQQRGAYIDTGDDNKEKFYNESYFEHFLRGIVTDYVAHTPAQGEPATKVKVGLDDLITAIKELKEEGGGTIEHAEYPYHYSSTAQALGAGWRNENNVWKKSGYPDIAGTPNDFAKLPTYKYYDIVSVAELPDLIAAINANTVQLKRIADSMTNTNS